MEKKKLKLSITGKSKKTIDNIELARSKGKNSVIIEKKNTKFGSLSVDCCFNQGFICCI